MGKYLKSAYLNVICAAFCAGLLLFVPSAEAQDSHHRFGVGAHFGVNLDAAHPMLGVDFLVDLVDISSRVRLGLWPKYTHVFIEDWDDVDMVALDVPFQFLTNNVHVRPYAAPGLGVAFEDGHAYVKLNLIGGCAFPISDRFEPYTHLAIRLIDGTFVDWSVGILARF